MRNPGNRLPIVKLLCSLLILFIAASTRAQTPISATAYTDQNEATLALAFLPRMKLSLTPYSFALMPATGARPNVGSGPGMIRLAAMAAGSNLQVLGSGTVGRLAKWTGLTSSNSFIGNSTIFEDKNGLVGIGTDSPTSKLTVQGMIETTLGGLKFPDGTVQTTSAAAALFSVARDNTLKGNGTQASPLGVAVPLTLSATLPIPNLGPSFILTVRNTGVAGAAIDALGGDSIAMPGIDRGGLGVRTRGGNFAEGTGGGGIISLGGFGNRGGDGMLTIGGNGINEGGVGVRATGGGSSGPGIPSGDGVYAEGGANHNAGGGNGVNATGGNSIGAGNSGGNGIVAKGGTGFNGATNGLAGKFTGDVQIDGALNVTGTKNFKIDHPLDPENKYLYHAAIESSEVLNIYSGNVRTNKHGKAVVTLPEWFEAVNRDLRYQLTVIGAFAQAIVAEKVKGNRFLIHTNAPHVEVSWQVTGVRSDAALRRTPFKAEEEKPEHERGTYLTPEAHGKSAERGIGWTRNPELMRQQKELREKARRRAQQ